MEHPQKPAPEEQRRVLSTAPRHGFTFGPNCRGTSETLQQEVPVEIRTSDSSLVNVDLHGEERRRTSGVPMPSALSRGHQATIKELICLSARPAASSGAHAATHPVQNVEAILQLGVFLHQLFQTRRQTGVLRVLQAIDVSGESLDLELLKKYLNITTASSEPG